MVVVSSGVGGRGDLSLAEVQCHLDKEGASDLVIDLIMNATSDRIFQESILLAIALLEGGNTVIQVSWGLLGAPGGCWVQECTAQTGNINVVQHSYVSTCNHSVRDNELSTPLRDA